MSRRNGPEPRTRAYVAIGLILLVGTSSWACQEGQGDSSYVVSVGPDSAVHVLISNMGALEAPLWRATRRFRATGADTVPWFRVKAARIISGGRVAVADGGNKAIYVLDPGGDLLYQIGSPGEGPGEFGSLNTLHVTEAGELVAYDLARRSLTWFDGDGRFSRSLRLPPPVPNHDIRPLEVSGDSAVFAIYGESRVFGDKSGPVRDSTPLFRVAFPGPRYDTLGVWAATEWNYSEDRAGRMRVATGFAPTIAVAGRNGRVVIGDTDTLNLTVWDTAHHVVMRVSGSGPRIATTDDDLRRWRENIEGASTSAPKVLRNARLAAPYHTVYPAFRDVATDDLGRLWIAAPARFLDRDVRWLVFGPDGTLVGALRLPASDSVLDVAGGRIVTLHRDAFDAEVVIAYDVDERR